MTLKKLINDKTLQIASSATISDTQIQRQYLGKNNDNKTLFDIASLTKLFTSTRILQLMEKGKLNLNDNVKIHLPLFQNKNITIKDCLLHRSGFKPSPSKRYQMQRQEIINSIMEGDDFKESDYLSTQYSCINFIILGLIIESLDKTDLDQSFNRYIFDPLKMSDTSFNPKQRNLCAPTEINQKRGLIQGIVHDQTAFAMGGVAGNAGLFSTLDDLIKFSKALMNNIILNEETIDLLFKTNVEKRSLGWNIFKENPQVLYHTGFTGPSITFDRENRKIFIVLTNRTFPHRNNTKFLNIRDEIIEDFLTKKL